MLFRSKNLTLEQAAKMTTIPKKSLDDYMYQIKKGFSYRFNFNEHAEDKIGFLRDFVRR